MFGAFSLKHPPVAGENTAMREVRLELKAAAGQLNNELTLAVQLQKIRGERQIQFIIAYIL